MSKPSRVTRRGRNLIVLPLLLAAVGTPSVAAAQAAPAGNDSARAAGDPVRSLGDISFLVPSGFTFTERPDHRAAHVYRKVTLDFCSFVMTPAVPTTGNVEADLVANWERLFTRELHLAQPEENSLEYRSKIGFSGRLQGAEMRRTGYATLFVLETGTQVIPISVICSSNSFYLHWYDLIKLFLDHVRIGPIRAQPSKSHITVEDLVGEWETGFASSVAYVNRYTGTYAGSATSVGGIGYTFKADGSWNSHFVGMNNGQSIKEDHAGHIEFSGSKLILRGADAQGTSTHQLISYDVAPDGSTVLTVLGPQYELTLSNISSFGDVWIRHASKAKQ